MAKCEKVLLIDANLRHPNLQVAFPQNAPEGDEPCLGLTSSFGEAELRAAGADYVAPDLARADSAILGPGRRG